jgi:hypothetical protein
VRGLNASHGCTPRRVPRLRWRADQSPKRVAYQVDHGARLDGLTSGIRSSFWQRLKTGQEAELAEARGFKKWSLVAPFPSN